MSDREAAAEEPRAERPVRRRRRIEGGRQHRHVVKVTDEEEALLLEKSQTYNVTVAKLLVDSALAGGAERAADNESVRQAVVTELFGLHRLLASISNNVNQLARVANSTGELPPQTGDVLDAVRRTAGRIDDAVDGLAR